MLSLLKRYKAWMSKRNNTRKIKNVEQLMIREMYEGTMGVFKKVEDEAEKIERQGMKHPGPDCHVVTLSHYSGADNFKGVLTLPKNHKSDVIFKLNCIQAAVQKAMAAQIERSTDSGHSFFKKDEDEKIKRPGRNNRIAPLFYHITDNLEADQKLKKQKKRQMLDAVVKFLCFQPVRSAKATKAARAKAAMAVKVAQATKAAKDSENEDCLNSSPCECDGVRTITERLDDIMETLADIGGQLLDRDGQVPEDVKGVGAQLASIGIGLAAGPGYKPPVDEMVIDRLPQDQGKDEDEVKEGCFTHLFNSCLNFSKPYDLLAPKDLYN